MKAFKLLCSHKLWFINYVMNDVEKYYLSSDQIFLWPYYNIKYMFIYLLLN